MAKTVRTPGTVSSAPPEYFMNGGNLVSVSCVYFASEAERTTVTVAYALPSDPNPFSDFNYGCGKGDVPWSAEYATFRAASIDQWAYATFASTLTPLPQRDVSSFTSVTRRLLAGTAGYGHPCDAAYKPTAVTPSYVFDFTLAKKRVETVFWVDGDPNRSGTYSIARVIATSFPLRVALNGQNHTLTLAFAGGIDFHPASGKTKGQATFKVRVVRSSSGGCRRGTTGTLTVTTQPSIRLGLCGGSVLGTGSLTGIRFHQQG